MSKDISLSPLGHTWIFDLDGTVLKHNGYLIDGKDSLLPEAIDFFAALPDDDMVVFVTSRSREYAYITEEALHMNGIRFNAIVYDAPFGERILVNDKKPSGLNCAIAVNTMRDEFMKQGFRIDEQL